MFLRAASRSSSSATPLSGRTRASRGLRRQERTVRLSDPRRSHGHFERAAADVDDEQTAGIPAIPTAGGQEGESGLIHAGQHGDRLADGLFDLA